MEKIRISVVSYLNARPFVYGLLNHKGLVGLAEITEDVPSDCAGKLQSGKVDIGLVPVAALPRIPGINLISDYCIGSSGKVRSVLLVSDSPVENLEEIILDGESVTSAALVQLLASEQWSINPEYKVSGDVSSSMAHGNTGVLMIGDKAMVSKKPSHHVYDLSEEWYKMTGLPFVFAVWASNRKLPSEFLSAFNDALKAGVSQIDRSGQMDGMNLDNQERKYLIENISYELDESKIKAMNYFLHRSGLVMDNGSFTPLQKHEVQKDRS